jgi:hypothetical protein
VARTEQDGHRDSEVCVQHSHCLRPRFVYPTGYPGPQRIARSPASVRSILVEQYASLAAICTSIPPEPLQQWRIDQDGAFAFPRSRKISQPRETPRKPAPNQHGTPKLSVRDILLSLLLTLYARQLLRTNDPVLHRSMHHVIVGLAVCNGPCLRWQLTI